MDKSRLNWLIERYHQNTATAAELQELAGLVAASGEDGPLAEALAEYMEQQPAGDVDTTPYAHLADKVLRDQRPKVYVRRWMWAAAASLLALAAGMWMRQRHMENAQLANVPVLRTNTIQPGTYGAILTLADGSTVMLDSTENGTVAKQNGADIVVNNNKVSYSLTRGDENVVAYNTLRTPKGRQFHVQLPDGTEVWLNAGSSINYPTVFSGKDRIVKLTGEAYFEVARNPAKPFRVSINNAAAVEVLGTHFNVNAYDNETFLTTTLLEGSVRFHSDGNDMVTLKPGQQSKLHMSTHQVSVASNVETEQVIAWKNGLFDFNNRSLREVMNQLERWYDIEVVYEKKVPDIRFFGKMTRNITLNDLLMILERSKVHFRIEGRKLVVLP